MGDGPNSYQFWLGGSPNQTRLAEPFQDRVKVQVLLYMNAYFLVTGRVSLSVRVRLYRGAIGVGCSQLWDSVRCLHPKTSSVAIVRALELQRKQGLGAAAGSAMSFRMTCRHA